MIEKPVSKSSARPLPEGDQSQHCVCRCA
jgi:hypothetical protein